MQLFYPAKLDPHVAPPAPENPAARHTLPCRPAALGTENP
jgi:hypothetical protein